jgi:hypothetical protein
VWVSGWRQATVAVPPSSVRIWSPAVEFCGYGIRYVPVLISSVTLVGSEVPGYIHGCVTELDCTTITDLTHHREVPGSNPCWRSVPRGAGNTPVNLFEFVKMNQFQALPGPWIPGQGFVGLPQPILDKYQCDTVDHDRFIYNLLLTSPIFAISYLTTCNQCCL